MASDAGTQQEGKAWPMRDTLQVVVTHLDPLGVGVVAVSGSGASKTVRPHHVFAQQYP